MRTVAYVQFLKVRTQHRKCYIFLIWGLLLIYVYIYSIGSFMLIRYVKSHVGQLLDSDGLDIYGKRIDVPALLRDGEHKHSTFRGMINAFECRSLQRVKLVGFTEYSFDDGKNWIKIPDNHYVIGVRKWREFYIVLFNGKPRVLPYTPKESERHYNNVHYIHKSN